MNILVVLVPSIMFLGSAAVGSGFLLKNVQSGLCVKDLDPKRESFVYGFEECPTTGGTQFSLLAARNAGVRFASNWTQPSGRKPNPKCAYANTGSQENVWSAGCNGRQHCPYFEWTLKDLGDEKFVIIHTMDNWCMKPKNGIIKVFEKCDEADPAFQWTRVDQNN